MTMLLDPPFSLTGELSLADVRAANRLLESRRPRKYRGGLRVAVASLGAGFGIAAAGFNDPLVDGAIILGLVAFALLFFIPVLANRNRLRRSWQRKDGVFRPVNTTIGPQGLRITEPHSTITVEWAHFIAAITGPSVVYVFPKEGWILFGRSRFADERDWNRFKTFVEDRWPVAPRLV
jgi:hypothetical protein